MTNRETIFIFTRDRPETLAKTLHSIQNTPYKKYIIDDSILTVNQNKVSNLCNYYDNCIYLGKNEFRKFVSQNNISFPTFDFLFREGGNTEWNLGYSRNFALLFSKSLCLEKVLFMDDDIQIDNPNLIDGLFQQIDNFQFVGAHITGVIDDSILGHMATALGFHNERMLSGGFMIFKPFAVDQYFLNNYNEDWIWLFLQLKGKKYLQIGEVFQELSNQISDHYARILFQEKGEIIIDGIINLYHSESYNLLKETTFWERILKERYAHINLLFERAKESDNKEYLEILELIKLNSEKFKAEAFAELFEEYFRNRVLFQSIYKSLS